MNFRLVTLVGYSLGAKVIFKYLECCFCLLAAELVERVVLLGSPIATKEGNWEAARKEEEDLIFS